MDINLTLTEGVSILSPRRRLSDRAGFVLRGKALTTTIPSLLAIAKSSDSAVLAVAAGEQHNHSWVEPDAINKFGDGHYVQGSHAHDRTCDVVPVVLTDGLGARSSDGVVRTVRVEVTLAAAEAFAYVASQTEELTVWIDGSMLTLTAVVPCH